ncbi:hypothetical protein LOTGIDRAFT_232050 [Lottia gigantea]|uniref:Innexin n=1 Tax=Lottia gigantea TaxID=225164 RepID=V4AP14_LOTGI|nr:hypothetical protein LOTGIDRAFT_232050 [Lottia gigantea]ESO95356.1 hypothetical protein LOTGIDRAFT_232050 [Lottia gigantea]
MATLLPNKAMFTNGFNYFWTAIFLLLPATSFIFIRILFTNSAIVCFVPSHMTISMGHFMHEVCWNKETYEPLYPVPSKNITQGELLTEKPLITSYHAWFPYILFVLFLLFTVFQGMCHLVKRGLDYRKSNSDSKLGERFLAAELSQRIEELSSQKFRTVSLIFLKFLIFLNVLAQVLYLLSTFGSKEKNSEYMSPDGEKQNYTYTDQAFPESVLCETRVRRFSTIETYTIHCNLPMNEVFKKYSILLCLWFVLVAILSLGHLICLIGFCFRKNYTKRLFSKVLPKEDVQHVLKRIQGTDGLFILWSIYRKEDFNVFRDVVQLLRGSFQSDTDDDQPDKKMAIAEGVPQIVVEQEDPDDGKLDVPKV